MKLNENILKYIKEEAARISHGRVIIEMNETANKIDVVSESRTRFKKEEKNKKN